MEDKESRVAIPEEMLQNRRFEDVYFPSNSDEVGIVVLSETEQNSHILRIFQLLLNDEINAFEPIQEMAAFRFQKKKEMTDFLERLPEMNGLEMLMLLNPIITDQEIIN